MTTDTTTPTLSPSAYVDTFARDNLPPAELWPILEFTTPELQYPKRLNAGAELIERAVDRFGADHPALRTPAGVAWTLGELRDHTHRIARVLTEDLGVAPGNRVLLRSPNTPMAVASWLAILEAGGIAVVVMSALRSRELTPIVDKTRPVVALVDARFAHDLHIVRDEAHPELVVVPFGGGDSDDLTARSADKPTDFVAVETAADDVAVLCPTSGSTGTPKITMHFHRDVLSIDNTFGKHGLGLRPGDVVACTAPMAFTFGLGMLVVFPLRAGACALLTDAVAPAELADLVRNEGVTVLATAPTAYKQIIKAGKISLLEDLRVAVSAGEHISAAVWNHIRESVGLEVIDGIGATELLHIFLSTAAASETRAGSTGKPVPGYRAEILGDDGEPVAAGVPGRLAVIGPVGCRYLADDRQHERVENGWNVTGDTFYRDEDGYFFYCARTDSMIVSSGYNIGAPEVEACIDTHPDVVDAAVIAEDDAERGQIVSAFVVLRDGVAEDAVTVKCIQDHVKAELAPYKYPRRIRFIDALPRNSSGKLQHFKLRETTQENPS
ncbi:2-aminobenzoate-CoA ligase [Rhodococcus sp. WWJCD1]|uniref:AMP-binding protein n=1 Tax=Rhodococcus sp. WWJCD1 TaxID=2022519 RepID=UPI000B9A26F9|nr:AMP-binding protein [Rhodococcus sp. WWJCD1]OZC52484.1 2-aminobenzoate-CoA ligase [Rhodococcus sp. WWJCD1]